MFFVATTPLFELFDNNLINWIILVVAIVFLCSQTLPAVFAGRKKKIENAIDEALQAKLEGQRFLEEQQARLASAEKEADNILVEARRVAEQIKTQATAQAKVDAQELEAKIANQITAQKQLAITSMRQEAAEAALRRAEYAIPSAVNDGAKSRLLKEFVDQLDMIGSTGAKA